MVAIEAPTTTAAPASTGADMRCHERNSIAVPETLAELLTPEWLNGALSTRFPGVNVTDVTPGPIVERVSTNARFRDRG